MTTLTLTYFDFAGGRGEASRLALHIAGVPWTDNRLAEGWTDKKNSTPFGGLPILELSGKGVISQSNAILGYIGRTYGLLPSDPWEAARHVAIMNAVESLRAEAATTGHADVDAKREARVAFAAGYLADWAGYVSAQIRGPFVGGAALSVADLKLYVAMRSYIHGVYDFIPPDVLAPYPKLTGLIEAVDAHPKVMEWNARA